MIVGLCCWYLKATPIQAYRSLNIPPLELVEFDYSEFHYSHLNEDSYKPNQRVQTTRKRLAILLVIL